MIASEIEGKFLQEVFLAVMLQKTKRVSEKWDVA